MRARENVANIKYQLSPGDSGTLAMFFDSSSGLLILPRGKDTIPLAKKLMAANGIYFTIPVIDEEPLTVHFGSDLLEKEIGTVRTACHW